MTGDLWTRWQEFGQVSGDIDGWYDIDIDKDNNVPQLTCDSVGQPCIADHNNLDNKSSGEHLASMLLFGSWILFLEIWEGMSGNWQGEGWAMTDFFFLSELFRLLCGMKHRGGGEGVLKDGHSRWCDAARFELLHLRLCSC